MAPERAPQCLWNQSALGRSTRTSNSQSLKASETQVSKKNLSQLKVCRLCSHRMLWNSVNRPRGRWTNMLIVLTVFALKLSKITVDKKLLNSLLVGLNA